MSVVTVFVTTSLGTTSSERRFDKALTVAALKGKLELITGCAAASMVVQLFDPKNNLITTLDNPDAMLGSYPVEDFWRLHAIETDKTRRLGEFEDTSKVDKFEMDDEEYAKRNDTVMAFKARNKLGRFADDAAEKQKAIDEEGQEDAAKITVGSRCEVRVDESLPRRGEVKYVGKTSFKPGFWVGVQYDEPLGKNDGSVEGRRYFTCPSKYGAFVRPKFVSVGDFPEEDFLGSDDEM